MRVASIDGMSSGRTWLRLRGESILATGFVGGGVSTQKTPTDYQAVIELIVAERVGDVVLYHLVPLFLPHDAEVTLDGQSVDASRLADLKNYDPDLSLSDNTEASAEFVLDEDRLSARSLTVTTLDRNRPEDWTDSSPPVGFLRATSQDPNRPWLTVRRGAPTTLTAWYSGTHGTSGTDSAPQVWNYYFVPDSLGAATVFHGITIHATPSNQQLGATGRDVELALAIDGSRFVPGK